MKLINGNDIVVDIRSTAHVHFNEPRKNATL